MMKISSVHNDKQRFDLKLDCTSCSISFPNYKLFYTFRKNKYPGTSWAIIVLDKDVLFSPTNIAYYCQTNAAGVIPRVSSVKELCTVTAFENMFSNSITTKENKLIERSDLKISDNMTTDPQAEGDVDFASAVWVKQSEGIKKEAGDPVTYTDVALMSNSTEIMAAIYDGTEWTIKELTDNTTPES